MSLATNAQQNADWNCNVQREVQRCTCVAVAKSLQHATQHTGVYKTLCCVARIGGFVCRTCNSLRVQTKGTGMQKLVALNELGRRVGETHPGAKLLDTEVDQVLDLLEAGLSYATIAGKFDVSKSCVAHIATGRRRSQTVARTVRVSVAD